MKADALFDFGLGALFIFACIFAVAFLLHRVKASVEQVEPMPLSPEDRLRVASAARHLEDAYRSIAHSAWINGRPGNPRVSALYSDILELERQARRIMRDDT